ncbi:MAG TPA: desulfoferrodoxin [Methanocorpusculum sp.]|nr:desulfoferrodoxin [Methanocorpusculum sp.]
MVKYNQVYKCPVCGNIIHVLHAGAGQEFICCGKPMEQLIANTTDAAKEKHVPAVEKIDGGFRIVVGSVQHPMDSDHFIEWITFIEDTGIVHRKMLKAGDKPEFIVKTDAKSGVAYEYCNKHGLWVAK